MEQDLLDMLRQTQNELGSLNEAMALLDKKMDDKADELLTGIKSLIEDIVVSEIRLIAESLRAVPEAQVGPEREHPGK